MRLAAKTVSKTLGNSSDYIIAAAALVNFEIDEQHSRNGIY